MMMKQVRIRVMYQLHDDEQLRTRVMYQFYDDETGEDQSDVLVT